MKKVSKFISRNSLLIVIISVFLLIPAFIGYFNTRVNYDILVYLPEDVDTIKGQDILTSDFGIGAFSFVTVKGMSNYDINLLENKISDIDGVNEVLSVADMTDLAVPMSMVPSSIGEKIVKGDETVILVTFEDSTSSDRTIDAVSDMRSVVGDASSVSGMTAMVLDTMNLSNQEIVIYVVIAVLLCLIVLTLATDSYIIPFLLIGNIGIAIIFNMGSNIFLKDVSYITKAITAVLQLGVTTDFSIFLYHKYEMAKEKYKDKKEAMESAIEETFKSVIGSSLTTIAGFLSLCFMDLTLGKDIGIVMAKGVLFGLICVLTVFPALLLVFDNLISKTSHKVIFPKFKGIQKFSVKYRVPVLILFVFVCGFAIYGNSNYDVYYKLDKSLPSDLPSSVANTKLAKDFNIISPEIIIVDKDLKVNEVKELTEEVKGLSGIDLVLAPSLLEEGGVPSSYISEISSIYKTDKYQMIILNSTYEVASDELNEQVVTLENLVKKYDENGIVAGEGALTKDLVKIADHDFKVVNYISILAVFVIMLFVLKSVSLPFILVFVIEMAVFSNLAISYYTGTTLPFIASIVIGTIQLGATIDYAILMSTKYLELRPLSKNKFDAMKETLKQVTSSIVVSALCFFSATFGVYVYSKIDMIGSICNLLSRGAIISMFMVILVLPALILLFDKVIMKTTKYKEV
ncbi:MAG: MMPL family transporter [bacterium]|nr:MMPL family transporter [bacterium]